MILKLAAVVAALALSATSQGVSGHTATGVSGEGQTVSQKAALTSGFVSPVSSTGSVEDKVSELRDNTSPVAQKRLNELIKTANVRKIKSHSGELLATGNASANETDKGYVMLRIPFQEKPNLLAQSGYTMFFDKSGNVVARGEIVLEQITDTSGRVSMWQDGTKLLDRIVDDPNSSVNGKSGQAEIVFSWDRLNSCLANAGIASWAITAIGIACGAACAATVGIGCIVCATAVSGIAGTTIGTCVGQAMAA